jgi:hypothetical protein
MIHFLFATAVALAGDWHGTSLCTNLKLLPGCHDEVVVYHLTPNGGKVHIAADKIVDGKPQNMGEFDLTQKGNRLTYEMTDGQGRRSLWDFTVKGSRMTGVLKMLPSGDVVRKIDVTRR